MYPAPRNVRLLTSLSRLSTDFRPAIMSSSSLSSSPPVSSCIGGGAMAMALGTDARPLKGGGEHAMHPSAIAA
ncbi:hypothetical protein PG987_007391 [Apiospora arundinis]